MKTFSLKDSIPATSYDSEEYQETYWDTDDDVHFYVLGTLREDLQSKIPFADNERILVCFRDKQKCLHYLMAFGKNMLSDHYDLLMKEKEDE